MAPQIASNLQNTEGKKPHSLPGANLDEPSSRNEDSRKYLAWKVIAQAANQSQSVFAIFATISILVLVGSGKKLINQIRLKILAPSKKVLTALFFCSSPSAKMLTCCDLQKSRS
jgi:hypothetical protein